MPVVPSMSFRMTTYPDDDLRVKPFFGKSLELCEMVDFDDGSINLQIFEPGFSGGKNQG